MCGIASVSLKKGLTQIQREKVRLNMQILGLYNDSRGGHGCGLYMNNQIFKGHDDDKQKDDTRLIGSLIGQDNWLMPKLKSNIMMMHARKATFGLQKEKNNHPFFIETGDPEKDLILVHNGSLKEVYKLCQEYSLKYVDYDVDSEVLATIIANHGLDILNKYKGAAALIWTLPIEPDAFYVYHGASKTKKNGELEEERPLWYLETKEGIYFSSMPESLNAIRDNLKQVAKCFVYNEVFKIKDGAFLENVYSVDRGDVNVETYTTNYTGNTYSRGSYGSPYNGYTNSNYNSKKDDEPVLDINLETLPYRATKETPKYKQDKTPLVYFHQGRYWYKEEKLNGEFFIDRKGVIFKEDNMQVIKYYFYRGVMLKGEEAYQKVLKEINNDGYSTLTNNELNFACNISKYATYPVVMLTNEGNSVGGEWRKCFYSNDRRLTGEFNLNPKWSNRTYHLKDGKLVRISTSIPKDEPKLLLNEKESNAPVVQLTIVGNFDKLFFDIQEAILEITNPEWLAIMEYTRQTLQKTSTLDPDDDEVQEFAHKKIRAAIAQKKTIREIFNDKDRELDIFLALSLELEEDAKKEEKNKFQIVDDEEDAPDDKTIDTALENYELSKMEDEIEGRLEDAIGLIKELHEDAETLETYAGVDIATESARVIKTGVDNIRAGLNDVFDKNNKQALNIELTNI